MSKPNYVPQKIIGNDLVVIRRSKVILVPNKPAFVGLCIWDLSKVLTHKFHYYYNKENK